MIDYFEEKRRLFGVEKLTSKIQLKDLDNESRYCLESGQLQLLPGRDRYVLTVYIFVLFSKVFLV